MPNTLVDVLRKEWSVVSGAPWSVVTLLVLAFGAGFIVARWHQAREIRLRDLQLADLRERLQLLPRASSLSVLTNAELRDRVARVVEDLRHEIAEEARAQALELYDGPHPTPSEMATPEGQRAFEMALVAAWEKRQRAAAERRVRREQQYEARFKTEVLALRDLIESRLPPDVRSARPREFWEWAEVDRTDWIATELERLARHLPRAGDGPAIRRADGGVR